ncbi:MAG: alpha/beta hydrolase [Proteobacteria bacterium]|nr:alpha/beta hydrolase [Pseudomonadota bacterium]
MNPTADYQFEYVDGQGRPGFPQLLAQYQRESDVVASSADARLDQPYGPHPRQRLDVFPSAATAARGVMLYLHAGYWQSRDKSLFRWLAPAFQRRGLHVVLANYPLCPEVTLPQLVQALQPAVAAAHGMAPEWKRLPLVVAGHSAGAHLASEFGLARGGLPAGDPARIDGIWAISGIYDLQPLRETTLNERLQLDEQTARRMSPIHRVGRDGVPAVWLVGGAETPEFLRQNRAMHEAWQAQGHWSACVQAAAQDHFTVLRSWAALDGGLDAVFDDWWAAVAARA